MDDVTSVPTAAQPVLRGGRAIGNITSAEFGWSVGAPLAYAWLPTDVAEGDSVTVSCAGIELPATVVADVQFDPSGERIRR